MAIKANVTVYFADVETTFVIEGSTHDEIRRGINSLLIDHGYQAKRAFTKQEKEDLTGYFAEVKNVSKADGRKYFNVVFSAFADKFGKTLEKPVEGKIISFTQMEFRPKDVIQLSKNDKGYLVGVVISHMDSEELFITIKEFAEGDEEIPF